MAKGEAASCSLLSHVFLAVGAACVNLGLISVIRLVISDIGAIRAIFSVQGLELRICVRLLREAFSHGVFLAIIWLSGVRI